jgi:hypothetical protein
MITHAIPDMLCPACGHHFTHAAPADDSTTAPEPGDITVCIRCASLMVFGDDMRLRLPTPAEDAECRAMSDVMEATQAIRDLNAEHTPPEGKVGHV